MTDVSLRWHQPTGRFPISGNINSEIIIMENPLKKHRQGCYWTAAIVGIILLFTTTAVVVDKSGVLEKAVIPADELTSEEMVDVVDMPVEVNAVEIPAVEVYPVALPADETIVEEDPNNGEAGHKPPFWKKWFGGEPTAETVKPALVTYPDTFVSREVIEGLHGEGETEICTYMEDGTLFVTGCFDETEVTTDGAVQQK